MKSLFISYSSADREFCAELVKHLRPLEGHKLSHVWHDDKIGPGENSLAAIAEWLKRADIIVILVSPGYLGSESCLNMQLGPAMRRWDEKSATVVPVIVRQCLWQESPLCAIQVLPQNARPINSWDHQDDAWVHVVRWIENVARSNSVSSSKATWAEYLLPADAANAEVATERMLSGAHERGFAFTVLTVLIAIVGYFVARFGFGVDGHGLRFASANVVGYAMAAGGPLILDPLLRSGPTKPCAHSVWPVAVQAVVIAISTLVLARDPRWSMSPWVLVLPLVPAALVTSFAMGVRMIPRKSLTTHRVLHPTVVWVAAVWCCQGLFWGAVVRHYELSGVPRPDAFYVALVLGVILLSSVFALLSWLHSFNKTLVTDPEDLGLLDRYCHVAIVGFSLHWLLGPAATVFFAAK